MPTPFFTIAEAAVALRRSYNYVYVRIRDGRLKAAKEGSGYVIAPADVAALMKAQKR